MKVALYQCGYEAGLSEIPLGIGSLISNCKAQCELVRDKKKLKGYDVIGLSSTAWGLKEAVEIRRMYPHKKVIIGGQGALWDGLKDFLFDKVIVGPGEMALNEFLGHEFSIKHIDNLVWPKLGGLTGKWIPVVTSRGCPYSCHFCSSHVFWGKSQMHSAEYLIDYFVCLKKKYKKNAIYIYDDLFILSKERLFKLLGLIRKKGERFKFRGFIRSSLFDDDVARVMKEIGFKSVRFGMESGSDRVLEKINKKCTVDDHQNAVDIANKYKIPICGSIISGLPGETEEDKRLTENFLKRNKNKFSISGNYKFKAFPGTKFYKGENPLKVDMRVR